MSNSTTLLALVLSAGQALLMLRPLLLGPVDYRASTPDTDQELIGPAPDPTKGSGPNGLWTALIALTLLKWTVLARIARRGVAILLLGLALLLDTFLLSRSATPQASIAPVPAYATHYTHAAVRNSPNWNLLKTHLGPSYDAARVLGAQLFDQAIVYGTSCLAQTHVMRNLSLSPFRLPVDKLFSFTYHVPHFSLHATQHAWTSASEFQRDDVASVYTPPSYSHVSPLTEHVRTHWYFYAALGQWVLVAVVLLVHSPSATRTTTIEAGPDDSQVFISGPAGHPHLAVADDATHSSLLPIPSPSANPISTQDMGTTAALQADDPPTLPLDTDEIQIAIPASQTADGVLAPLSEPDRPASTHRNVDPVSGPQCQSDEFPASSTPPTHTSSTTNVTAPSSPPAKRSKDFLAIPTQEDSMIPTKSTSSTVPNEPNEPNVTNVTNERTGQEEASGLPPPAPSTSPTTKTLNPPPTSFQPLPSTHYEGDDWTRLKRTGSNKFRQLRNSLRRSSTSGSIINHSSQQMGTQFGHRRSMSRTLMGGGSEGGREAAASTGYGSVAGTTLTNPIKRRHGRRLSAFLSSERTATPVSH